MLNPFTRQVGSYSPRIRERSFSAARDANVGMNGAQDLRREDGVPTNESPYVMPFAGELYQLEVSSFDTDNMSINLLVDGAVVASLTQTNNQVSQIIEITPAIPVLEGSLLRIRYQGGSDNINRPAATVQLRETL